MKSKKALQKLMDNGLLSNEAAIDYANYINKQLTEKGKEKDEQICKLIKKLEKQNKPIQKIIPKNLNLIFL